ncbi:unnamed protein product, partial [Meganyctiphanes norvegica]
MSPFSDKSSCRRHQRIHTGGKPYQCSQCDNRMSVVNIKEEIGVMKEPINIHSVEIKLEEDIKINEDPIVFTGESHLVKHDKLFGEKPSKCRHVNRAISIRSDSKIQISKTGEKPYQCRQYDKAFTYKTYPRNHQRTHTGEKPFKCSQCEKTFSHKGTLITHQKIHT